MRFNATLIKSTVVGALGGLLFGFDTAVISGTTHALTQTYHLSPGELGLTVSVALWGTVVGALFSGVPGQRYGGRATLQVLALFYVLSALGCGLAWNWPVLLSARFLGGLAIGGSSVLGPVYIAEIAPAEWRGRLVGFFQINVVIGILLAYASNYGIARLDLGAREWRWELGVAGIPAALFLALLLAIPNSPRWLATQARMEEACRALRQIGVPNPQRELDQIVRSLHLERAAQAEPLFSAKYRKPIFLAVTMGMFNQLSGINAILYYLNDIFAAAGFGKMSADLQAVAIGAMNLVATLFAMTLIDRVGRKRLLLAGAVGTFACLSGVSLILLTHQHRQALVWLLVAYIAFFAVSQGAVIWVYISEIFPTRVRAKGQSLGSGSHWVMNAIISAVFPLLATSSGAYPFVFFAGMMAVQFFVVLFLYPETKGISLEAMQQRLAID
jgi:SP family arabinose:H+ symporter-like MFS transporter